MDTRPTAGDARAPPRRLELADVVRAHGAAACAGRRLAPVQYRALRAIAACRTPALGGQLAQCDACGAVRYLYHSCRNRHCPKCQTLARERWLAARRRELLPVPYFHLVFTLPHELNPLVQAQPAALYGMLFAAVSATLLEFGANARWLGGEIAATLVLHTWGQNLNQHVHLHCLVAAGALHPDGHWIHARRGFLFPVQALSRVFRGKFVHALEHAFAHGTLPLAQGDTTAAGAPQQLLGALHARPWVVYAKRAFGGPEQVLDYLGRYTHRVAISNDRLLSCDEARVRFRYRDYSHGNRRRVMCLEPTEFLRRFLLHVLPKGFMRIRHYGLLANHGKCSKLTRARQALATPAPAPAPAAPAKTETLGAFWLRVARIDIERCPHCTAGRMRIISRLAAIPIPVPP
ncbi:MAG TPA: IS91 family transposase [Burkholderiales bacterium]|uniref:IS91 family transposase n=1 Tax=Ensifer sp. SSB1 TaxID=2795385 RepID=UPI001A4E42D4|nr:IS91 family transposase [Ensifer sp. SSB1]MBK5571849.1 IS91 family transposase [Ensifer sp. SSB1]HEX2831360.1 IS91 family transposase [Burkholderiales bacterium]